MLSAVITVRFILSLRITYPSVRRMRWIAVSAPWLCLGCTAFWDTAENTGVLIYVNVCEHDLEVIADRGIDDLVDDEEWLKLTQNALNACKQGNFGAGLTTLITEIGNLMRIHYPGGVLGNELNNDVVFLK